MYDIGFGLALEMGLLAYLAVNLLFAGLGSLGLHRLLASRRSRAAAYLPQCAFVLVMVSAVGGLWIFGLDFINICLLATCAYAVLGLTATFIWRRPV